MFGDQVASSRKSQISIKFGNGTPTEHLTFSTTGITTTNSTLEVTSTDGSPRFVMTKDAVDYTSGQEVYCFFTAGFDNLVSTSDIHICSGSDTNGYRLRYHTGDFHFELLNNGTIIESIPRSDWLDKLDGTGHSGFVWDPAMLNIFYIRYGYLGIAPSTISISTPSGNVAFAVIDTRNRTKTINLGSAYIPIRGQATDGLLRSGSWAAGQVAQEQVSSPEVRFGAKFVLKNLTGTSRQHLLSIRKQAGFDFIPFSVVFVSVSSEGTKSVIHEVVETPTFGGALTWVSAPNGSMMEYSTTDTTVIGGETAMAFPLAKQDSKFSHMNDRAIKHNGGEVITFAVNTQGSTEVVVSTRWKEFF